MANSMQNDFKVGTKVVDATKVETTQTARVDTSGIAQALQKIVGESMANATATSTINPAQFITEQAGPRLKKLYDAYEELREFARHLNGLQANAPLPQSLGFESLELVYRPDGKEQKRVKLVNVAFVGQISSVLSTEMGVLLFAIQKEVDALNDITTRTKEQITRARDAWAAANKDTKIEEVAPAVDEAPQPPEVAVKE